MIIKALADAAAHLDVPPAGYQIKATPWALTLTAGGDLVSLVKLEVSDRAGKPAAPRQRVPKVTRTVNVAPQLGCDTGVYVLGMAKPSKPPTASDYDPWTPAPRDTECHEAWVAMMRDWEAGPPEDPAATAILTWIDAGKPGLAAALPTEVSDLKALAVGNIVIHLDGDPTPAHLHPSAISHWQGHVSGAKASATGLCSACGSVGPLVDSFPAAVPVQAAPGADPTGAALTSGNFATASRDLTATQLKNAPTCLTCAVNSVAALTALAQDDKHRWRGDDAWTVWWLRSGATPDLLDWLNQPPDPHTVAQVFDQVRAGIPAPQVGDPGDDYFALTYSARGPRIVVRSWVSGPLGEAVEAIAAYFADSAVERPWQPGRLWEPLWLVAKAAGTRRVRGGKAETISPHGAHEALLRAALTRGGAPASLLSGTVRRSRAEIGLAGADSPAERDEHASREHARMCLIRLILTRSPHLNGAFTVPGAALDPHNPDPAYLCGRLFAEYEGLQRAALGKEVNATITDRTYGKAMTNPQLIYPSLDRLAKAHLRKLRTSDQEAAASAIDRRITGLVAAAGPLPAALDVPGQARWMLGYYQQRAANTAHARARVRDGGGDVTAHTEDPTPAGPHTPDA